MTNRHLLLVAVVVAVIGAFGGMRLRRDALRTHAPAAPPHHAGEAVQPGSGRDAAAIGAAPDAHRVPKYQNLHVERFEVQHETVCNEGQHYQVAAYLPDGNWHTFDVQLWQTTCDVRLSAVREEDGERVIVDGERRIYELRPVGTSVDYVWAYACASGAELAYRPVSNGSDQTYLCFSRFWVWGFADATRPITPQQVLPEFLVADWRHADAWFDPKKCLPRAEDRSISGSDVTVLSLIKDGGGAWTLVVEDDLTKREYTLTSADGKTDWQIVGEKRLKR